MTRPWMGSIAAVGSKPTVLAYMASGLSTVNPAATINFGAQNIGVAATNRLVIAIIQHVDSNNRTFSSCSIGGAAATTLIYQVAGNGFRGIAICSRVVPTGTTAAISASFTSGVNQAGFAVYTVNQDELKSILLRDVKGNSAPATPLALNFSDPTASLIGGICQSNATAPTYVGWTRNSNLLPTSGATRFTTGSNGIPTNAAHDISATNGSGFMAAAVFGVN